MPDTHVHLTFKHHAYKSCVMYAARVNVSRVHSLVASNHDMHAHVHVEVTHTVGTIHRRMQIKQVTKFCLKMQLLDPWTGCNAYLILCSRMPSVAES